MRTLNLKQGEPAWHAHRSAARNASDAPAVIGCSPYTTRSELLHQRHTGVRPEVGALTQRRFEDGHVIEAAQLPGAEEIVGEALYPVVGVEDVDGIELSASFDGITMAEDVIYECKTINDDLRACMPNPGTDDNDGRDLPKHYRVQCEQQLAVSGAERVLFVAATLDGSDVRRCWYYPDLQLRAEIIAAWRQFDADLVTYTPPPASSVEKIVAEPVEALPAPVVQVTGTLTLSDNFSVFEQRLRHFLAERLIREPKSDQDFADLDGQIKAMKQARVALKAAGAQMLAQLEPVDRAAKTQAMLDDLLQKNCSMAEKLLASEKERRRGEIVNAGAAGLRKHVDGLNAQLGHAYMPASAAVADFAGCIKGLKSLASMEDRVSVTLANAKIAADETFRCIQANLGTLREHASEFKHLFPDTATIVLKAPDDCRAVITSRIAEHQAKVQREAEAAAERERARIRAEEQARAQREAQEAAAREQRQREETAALERRQREEAEARAEQQRREEAAAAEDQRRATAAPAGASAAPAQHEPAPAPHPAATNVLPMPTKAPAGPPTLRLGDVQKAMAPLSITAEGLRQLGFEPAGRQGAAVLYRDDELPYILTAAIQHLTKARDEQRRAA